MILRNPTRTVLPCPIRVADDYEEAQIIMEDLKNLLNLRLSEVKDLFNQMSADWEKLTVDRARFPNPHFIGAWDEHRRIYGYTLRSELVYQLKLALEQEQEDFDFGAPIQHLLVDEYQDLNPCDLSVIKQLTEFGAELFCAGDDDQSIYGFRYANPEGIRRFPEEYDPSESLVLKTCMRCDEDILSLGMYVAQQDIRRIEKELSCCEGVNSGEVHILRFNGQRQEADGIADLCYWLIDTEEINPEKILILLRSDRNGIFSDVLIGSLEHRHIPVNTYCNPLAPLETNEGRCFLCLLYLLVNRQDNLSWRVLLKLRENDIGDTTFRRVYDFARREGHNFSEALNHIAGNPRLVERRGDLIRQEFNQINEILEAVNIDNIDDLANFIENLAIEQINDDELRNKIISLFQRIIQQSEEANLEWLLRAINVSLLERDQDISEPGAVRIMTMHQAKGLTADAVFIAACEDEYIPGRAVGEQIDDERRLLYVSLTRAKHYLYITHCGTRTGRQTHSGSNSGDRRRTLTRFLRGCPVRPVSGINYINQI
jgi:DNA helicase-2/ATP-dependent DNA helicase PcrA